MAVEQDLLSALNQDDPFNVLVVTRAADLGLPDWCASSMKVIEAISQRPIVCVWCGPTTSYYWS
jgi:hypothetical protein